MFLWFVGIYLIISVICGWYVITQNRHDTYIDLALIFIGLPGMFIVIPCMLIHAKIKDLMR